MPAELTYLNDWAATVIAQLPADSEPVRRAQAAVFLLGWSVDARSVLLELRPMVDDSHPLADQIDELLTRWGREVA